MLASETLIQAALVRCAHKLRYPSPRWEKGLLARRGDQLLALLLDRAFDDRLEEPERWRQGHVEDQLADGALDDLAIRTRYLDYKYGGAEEHAPEKN